MEEEMNKEEKNRVEEIANNNGYGTDVNPYTTEYSGRIFMNYMKKGSVLELGPAEGVMTNMLYPHFSDYTVVDGAEIFVRNLKNRFQDIKGFTSLFEEYETQKKYDNIVMGHVLEHVDNPVAVLKKYMNFLEDDGVIVAAVPNCNSLHRLAAVKMGMLEKANSLSETDYKVGHRRVYSYKEFIADFQKAGFEIVKSGGYWLKPLSNRQIEESWSKEMIWAFMELGEDYPEIAAEIYVIAKKGKM